MMLSIICEQRCQHPTWLWKSRVKSISNQLDITRNISNLYKTLSNWLWSHNSRNKYPKHVSGANKELATRQVYTLFSVSIVSGDLERQSSLSN